MKPFATRVLDWFDAHGRHDLPWQHPRTPYRVWVAEIMLQQTQVAAVLPYYRRFVARFPDLAALATAEPDAVLAHWSGLGYYARARNLHRAAQRLYAESGGVFPTALEGWLALPGIGRSTAAAILSQACGQRHAILDGNVRRLLARHAAIEGWPGQPPVSRRLWALAEAHLPNQRMADYTQAMMDLGATVCRSRQPRCAQCPLSSDCAALAQGTIGRLPSPRPRRPRPRRQAVLLLLGDGSRRWLLERRPPSGIWGGLWCPPMADGAADIDAGLRQRFGIGDAPPRRLPPVEHAFTHFQLQLQPVVLAARPAAEVRDHDCRWLTMEEIGTLGVPAPVRRVFNSIQRGTLLS